MQLTVVRSMLLATPLMTGCATTHVDEIGQRHIVGFVWMTLPPPAVAPVGAEALHLRAFGVVVSRSPVGNSLVLGFSDSTLTAIRNDAEIHLSAEEKEP